MENNTFIGTGHNPGGPDLPMGFGMQLAQHPEAMNAYGRLTKKEQTAVIGYIQACTSGEDSKNRIANAVNSLKENRTDFF